MAKFPNGRPYISRAIASDNERNTTVVQVINARGNAAIEILTTTEPDGSLSVNVYHQTGPVILYANGSPVRDFSKAPKGSGR